MIHRNLYHIHVEDANNRSTVRGYLSAKEVRQLTDRCAKAHVTLTVTKTKFPRGLRNTLNEGDYQAACSPEDILLANEHKEAE